ncbi:protein SLX4IP isoform X1 [Pezoporus wallicus]|uniref:protein SLX4IP isoform X1 n=1 Tax=Pezoporus wallicus TaxID=35540 RepID=UPI00254E25A6|nr:protein SLX4IP isoform X1 [Pezoporus wallicus]XP_057279286.1 protein SLX4IP isoform X1 [Pezoporus wallicus]
MASNKFVIKCGNFAVLVDVHILPQGSSKDTSWFSDHEKENVCMLLEEVITSRVKQYLEAPKGRGQWKSMERAPSGPLFLTANSLHITAYFMKRWVNLRCAVGKRYRDLRVFPDRFIVCVSKLDSNPSDWTCDDDVLKEELSSGTSEYFTESAENKKVEISLNEQIKQGILKEIVKRTKLKQSSTSKPLISKDSKKVSLGSVDSQTGNRKNDCQTSLSPQSEVTCRRSPGLLKDCTNTIESNLELPVLELENYINQRQTDGVSSQKKPHSVEWLKSSLLSENPPCSSESALLGPKRSQKVTKTQAQQKTCAPEEKLEHFGKVSSEGTPLIPSNTEMSKCDDGCLGPFLEEKTPLNSGLFSKRDMTKAASDEESLRKNLSQPLSVGNNIAQTSQNEPSTTPEDVMPPSCIELQLVPSEKLSQKRKKEVENGLRKLKLRRLKKS